MADFKAEAVIICDEVRTEINGKSIIIGVYSGDIVMGGPPPGMLGLTFYIEFSLKNAGEHSLGFKVEVAGERVFETKSPKLVLTADQTWSVPVGPHPIAIPATGALKLSMRLDEGKWKLIKSKNVRTGTVNINPNASVSPLPSEQSQPAAQAS
jgi:hypothetical protein